MDEKLYENQDGRTDKSQYGREGEPYSGWQPGPGQPGTGQSGTGQSQYPDYGQYPGWQQNPVWERQTGPDASGNYGMSGPGQTNYMALASMIIGILSIVTACCFFAAFALGGMAVIFAALSRVDESLSGKGKAGLITGIIGIAAGCASVILWISFGA